MWILILTLTVGLDAHLIENTSFESAESCEKVGKLWLRAIELGRDLDKANIKASAICAKEI